MTVTHVTAKHVVRPVGVAGASRSIEDGVR